MPSPARRRLRLRSGAHRPQRSQTDNGFHRYRLKTAQLSFNGGGTWQANHLTVSYAANGNNTSSSDGRSIEYTVFDKAWKIQKGNTRTLFDYGIGHSRYRRFDEQVSGGAWDTRRTTTYLGSVEYIEDHVQGESYFLRRIAGVALQRYYVNTGIRQTDFLIKDHLGSIHTVVQENGALERMHFSAFGERVSEVDWTATLGSATALNEISTRGFTGHEHVDDLGIIHTR